MMNLQRVFVGAVVLVLGLYVGAATAQVADGIAVKDGQKVAFLGDSITQQGWGSPTGYVRLIVSGLASNGIKVVPVPAGISGHKSNDMLARLDRDVISQKPDWVTVSCGVNDVWHGANGVPLPQYKENMTAIVDKAQAAGIKVMILTATMIGENAGEANNQKLKDYNAFLKELAAEKKCLLADLNADMQAALAQGEAAGKRRGNMLTADGVHMNVYGNMMMARGVLKAFGLNEDQLAIAKKGWLDIADGVGLQARKGITIRQYQALEALAAERKCSMDELLNGMFTKGVAGLLGEAESKQEKAAEPAK